MSIVTIVIIVEAYTRDHHNNVWIVPGSTEDFEDPSNEDRYPHIDDYLSLRGVCVASKIKPADAMPLADDIASRFRAAGFNVICETLCND